jgi:hypothetical protein
MKYGYYILIIFLGLSFSNNLFADTSNHGSDGLTQFESGNEMNYYSNGNPGSLYIQYRGGSVNMCNGSLQLDNNSVRVKNGGGYTLFHNGNEMNFYSGSHAPATLSIQYQGGSTDIGNKAIFIRGNNGPICMGTYMPKSGYRLTVAGGIYAEKLRIKNDVIADYVFEDSYKLMPLDKLETSIKTNKHLPGIPSQKTVQRDGGIDVGTFQVKLLEKIEELTLYAIAQNKKIKTLEEKLENLINKENNKTLSLARIR